MTKSNQPNTKTVKPEMPNPTEPFRKKIRIFGNIGGYPIKSRKVYNNIGTMGYGNVGTFVNKGGISGTGNYSTHGTFVNTGTMKGANNGSMVLSGSSAGKYGFKISPEQLANIKQRKTYDFGLLTEQQFGNTTPATKFYSKIHNMREHNPNNKGEAFWRELDENNPEKNLSNVDFGDPNYVIENE